MRPGSFTSIYRKEPREALKSDIEDFVPMRLKGWINLIPLALVIVAVLFSKELASGWEMPSTSRSYAR